MRTIIRNNYDPHTGDYHERIIQDEAREKTWLFDCDGVYLDITAGRGDVKVVNELGDSEVDATSQKLVTDELGKKQDTLVAGDNITIEGNVISAGGGNYTAGYGLTLHGTEFAANTSVLATQTDLAGKQDALSQAQLAAVNSGIDSGKVGQIAANASDIDTIEGKIPAQASSSNQLADKDFVNSSVATNTANYISNNGEPFASLAQLEAYSGDLSNNDYAFVVGTDSAGNTTYTRYKYVADIQEWAEEYVLNNSSFTANQWASINSGVTSGDVTKLAGITAGAEPNAIDSISVNGTTVTPDANKNVDLGIPDSAFIGTDGTAAGAMGLVPAPATTDAGKFLKADGTWGESGGGITTLTEADYDYHDSGSEDNSVALWRLPAGIYLKPAGLNAHTMDGANGRLWDSTGNKDKIIIVTPVYENNQIGITVFGSGGSTGLYMVGAIKVNSSGGMTSYSTDNNNYYMGTFLTGAMVVDTLTSRLSKAPLSANQGRILNNNIGNLPTLTTTDKTSTVAAINELDSELDDAKPLSGSTAPTTSTEGALGQTYVDTSTGDIYYLSEIDETTTPATYTWEKIVTGNGVNVVQTTGTSTTDVMSQNAVMSMVYANPSTKSQIRIGKTIANVESVSITGFGDVSSHTSGQYSVELGSRVIASAERAIGIGMGAAASSVGAIAIGGNGTRVTAAGGIALGAGATVHTKGVMNIGADDRYSATAFGYNSSNYRLLTGLYDPQSAHDAATKGYVDGAVINGGTTQPTTSTVGAVGTQYNCVNNGTPEIYICTDTTGGTYTWTKIN